MSVVDVLPMITLSLSFKSVFWFIRHFANTPTHTQGKKAHFLATSNKMLWIDSWKGPLQNKVPAAFSALFHLQSLKYLKQLIQNTAIMLLCTLSQVCLLCAHFAVEHSHVGDSPKRFFFFWLVVVRLMDGCPPKGRR